MLWAIKFKKGLMPPLTTTPTSDKIDLPKSALLRFKTNYKVDADILPSNV